jgi:hypothetical protein
MATKKGEFVARLIVPDRGSCLRNVLMKVCFSKAIPTLALVVVALAAPSAWACGGGQGGGAPPQMGSSFAQMGSSYNPQLAALQQQVAMLQQQLLMQQMMAQQQALLAKQQQLIAKFDSDGDGKLSAKERLAAKRQEKEARIAAKLEQKANRNVGIKLK